MGLGAREGKDTPMGQANTPSVPTMQPWLLDEMNCHPIIPAGKPSNDSFNYPGFSKILPQRQPAPVL